MRIRIRLFTLMRIRIRLLKMMLIRIRNTGDGTDSFCFKNLHLSNLKFSQNFAKTRQNGVFKKKTLKSAIIVLFCPQNFSKSDILTIELSKIQCCYSDTLAEV
jgi:hypothetical protein